MRGCRCTGTVFANDREVEADDFGKFGAFVAQDDVLVEQ